MANPILSRTIYVNGLAYPYSKMPVYNPGGNVNNPIPHTFGGSNITIKHVNVIDTTVAPMLSWMATLDDDLIADLKKWYNNNNQQEQIIKFQDFESPAVLHRLPENMTVGAEVTIQFDLSVVQ